jgi:hypothetical protein
VYEYEREGKRAFSTHHADPELLADGWRRVWSFGIGRGESGGTPPRRASDTEVSR